MHVVALIAQQSCNPLAVREQKRTIYRDLSKKASFGRPVHVLKKQELSTKSEKMAVRVQFEGNNEVGVFTKLTNAYCLVAIGGSANFYRFDNVY